MTKTDNGDTVPTVTDTEANQEAAQTPAFTPKYWAKAPRQLMPPATVMSIGHKDTGPGTEVTKEYLLDSGAKFSRPAKDIKQLILVGTQVQVELIKTGGGQMLTGLYVPQVKGWAWQMSAQDLADYAKEVTDTVTQERMNLRLAITAHLKGVFIEVLTKRGLDLQFTPEMFDEVTEDLAVHAVIAMEEGPA